MSAYKLLGLRAKSRLDPFIKLKSNIRVFAFHTLGVDGKPGHQ